MTTIACLLALVLAGPRAAAAPAAAPAPPDLSTAAWANVPGPLSLAAFRGRPVLLELSSPWSGEGERALLRAQAAQAAHPDSAVLVSVRTPRGGDPAGRAALESEALRRRILTPMVEDRDAAVARAYGVTRLPAQVLLDARGRFAARFEPGEPPEKAAAALSELVARARADHELWTSTGPAAPAWDSLKEGPLQAPTCLSYDRASDRLAVCDTGHDRVVVARADGRVTEVAGIGVPDYRDGPLPQAAFDRPRAAAFTGEQLAVADSANDYIRVVQSTAHARVDSWFGGTPSTQWPASLLINGRTLFYGVSATHELYEVDLPASRIKLAGDGKAGDRDGLPPVARLREPGALALSGDTLFVADPEAGLLRSLSLSTPSLATPRLTGTGAPLLRPTALSAIDGKILIADAGDGALKQLDPATGELLTLVRGLRHPAGLAVVGGAIVVSEADTGRLLRFSPAGKPAGELRLRGLKPLPAGPPTPALPARGSTEDLPAVSVRAGALDELELSARLPEGMILNPRAPFRARFAEAAGQVRVPLDARRDQALPPDRPLRLKFKPAAGSAELVLEADLFYCRKDRKGLCFAAAKRYRLPVQAVKGGPRRAKLAVTP
jgi:hypothetical protein